MALTLAIQLETDVILAELTEGLTAGPAKIQKAYRRAIRKMVTWLRRQVLRASSQATGIAQKAFEQNLRLFVRLGDNEGGVWLGLNPIEAARLGPIRWNRRMAGARVGKKLYPGTFAGYSQAYGRQRVYRRKGAARLPLLVERESIHDPIMARMERIEDEAQDRFERFLRQELAYALKIEGAK